MKILIITGSFPPIKCGVGDYTSLLATHLAENTSIEVTVLTSSSCKADLKNVRVFPIINTWDMSSLSEIKRVVDEIRPDLIHIQYPTTGYERYMTPSFIPLVLRLSGAYPIVQTWHEPLSKKGWIRYLPNTLVRSTLIFVENGFMKKLPRFYYWLLRRNQKFHVPISSNIPKAILSEKEVKETREKLVGIDNLNKNTIAYFGFITPKKGIEQLIEASDPTKDNLILLCEFNEDNPYHVELKRYIEKSKWKENIIVTGYLSDEKVANYLSVSDMAVFPFTEGSTERNGSILAARMQGTFVITTSNDGEGLTHEGGVYLVPPNDEGKLSDAISVHRRNSNKSDKSQVLSWSEVANKHVEIYQKTIQKLTGGANVKNV